MRWRLGNRIIEIGEKFIIAPPDFESNRIKITLGDGKSFGTGVHQTTKSCMEILEEIGLNGKSLLDIGIGSGILSIAAVKLNARYAVGFDIEKFAVEECKRNAAINGVRVDCFVADSPFSVKGRFDIVVANIFDDIILSMRDGIVEKVKKDGLLLLSGIVPEENFRVKKTFIEKGFELLKNVFLDEYTTMLFRKC